MPKRKSSKGGQSPAAKGSIAPGGQQSSSVKPGGSRGSKGGGKGHSMHQGSVGEYRKPGNVTRRSGRRGS